MSEARWRLASALTAFAVLLLISPGTAHAANLRLVSFNVAMGKVMRLRSKSTLRASFTEDPRLGRAHVLVLQELCLRRGDDLGMFLDLMRDNHGAQYHYSDYAGSRRGCGKGQAIVSVYPIRNAGTLSLPRVGARRSAVWVDLEVEGPDYDRLRVYDVHLSNRDGWNLTPIEGRWQQARTVLRHALEFRGRHPGTPIVLAGDFNALGRLYDISAEELTIRQFSSCFRPAMEAFEPTMLLPYKADWIFFDGLRLRRSKVVHVLFSDHFPVAADFDF